VCWVALVIGILVIAGFGAWVADKKGRDHMEGFMLGLSLGLLGVIVEALLSDKN
jgi:cytochrome bd-type quinol oxidase subunit 1